MKRIVVCCDGSWNRPENDAPTNVVKTARAIRPTDAAGVSQVVYYDWGVGTGNVVEKYVGGAFGKGLSKNIRDGYRFLVHNFDPGDEIYLFGFSRGAYTARSLAGFIRNAGILRKGEAGRIRQAYGKYRDPTWKPRHARAVRYRGSYSYECRIRFIGVWDTVGALGIPGGIFRGLRKRYKFHDTELSSCVDSAYHALAIDERRRDFRPTLWEGTPGAGQSIEQVWFAGVHADVGGSYPVHTLGDITLAWMVEKATASGLAFDDAYLSRVTRPVAGRVPHDSYRGIFKRKPPRWRRIGTQPQTHESVHPSAIDRFRNRRKRYAPENLARYLSEGLAGGR